jgi:hypothetical protein
MAFQRMLISYALADVRDLGFGRRKLETSDSVRRERTSAYVLCIGCDTVTWRWEWDARTRPLLSSGRSKVLLKIVTMDPEVWCVCLGHVLDISVCHVKGRLWGIALSSPSTNSFLVLLECVSSKKGKVVKLVSCVTLQPWTGRSDF